MACQQLEYPVADFRQVVLGVEHDRRLTFVGLHRGHVLEVRVGQQFVAQQFQFPAQSVRIVDLQLAENEVVRTAFQWIS